MFGLQISLQPIKKKPKLIIVSSSRAFFPRLQPLHVFARSSDWSVCLTTLQKIYYTLNYPYLIHCNTIRSSTYPTRLRSICVTTNRWPVPYAVPYACAQPYHPTVAAMDSCFVLVRTHQLGIAPGRKLDKVAAYPMPFTAEASAKHS